MIDQPIPLYYQIKEEIANKIENDEICVGHAIPTEKEIMKNYCVSRTTARRAVDALRKENYVYILRGKGTFVKERKLPQALLGCSSCTEMLKRMGYSPTVKLIGKEVLVAPNKVSERLKLEKDSEVFNIRRVNYVDETPMNFTNSYINIKHCTKFDKYDFETLSMYDTLKKEYGIVIKRVQRTVEAVLPTIEVADILKIETNMPILKFSATVFAGKADEEIAIETYRTYFRSDRAKFVIDNGEIRNE